MDLTMVNLFFEHECHIQYPPFTQNKRKKKNIFHQHEIKKKNFAIERIH